MRLNSTMVRFKYKNNDGKKGSKPCLNSTMVRFKYSSAFIPIIIGYEVSIPLWFDSNLPTGTMIETLKESQFHYGSIQIWYTQWDILYCERVSIPLWFDSNSLKETSPGLFTGSQFHYGSIQIHQSYYEHQSNMGSLNSTMVRFK